MTGIPTQGWASNAGLFSGIQGQPVSADTLVSWIAINEVFSRYGYAHDEVDFEGFGEAFAPDGILEVSIAGPIFERHEGRVAIIENFKFVAGTQSDQRRHAISNLVVAFVDDTHAQARAYGIVSAADEDGIMLAVSCAYSADLACGDDGRWRFSRLWIGMDKYTGKAPGAEIKQSGEKNA